MNFIDLDFFIKGHITERKESLFQQDIDDNFNSLNDKIFGKSVLVIGGAGTIGSSFIKSILNYKPSKLVVVDTNENGLTELTRLLRSTNNQYVPDEYFTYPMSFSDSAFEKMFMHHKPFNIVANFAAHKHVRSEKDIFSIQSMIENNLLKAKKLMDILVENKPKHFFCVSTDKAANPVNIMGASKKLMENMIMNYSDKLNITTARFANVAFSNGSLLEGHLKRILNKQPISCPSDVKRYFVSPEESGQICMIACLLGKSGDIFFPKLPQTSMKNFSDITLKLFKYLNKEIIICNSDEEARNKIINLDDNSPYPVYFFKTDTSGEKLFEEFYEESDKINNDSFNSLGIIHGNKSKDNIFLFLEQLNNLFKQKNYNKNDIVNLLSKYIKTFNHTHTGKNLDQKM